MQGITTGILRGITIGIGSSGDFVDPLSLSGLVAWYDFTDNSTITLNGSNVSAIDDKGPNGYDLTEAVASRQPLLTTNAFTGGQVARFDGGDVLIGLDFSGMNANKITVFCVYKSSRAVNSATLFDKANAAWTVGFASFQSVTGAPPNFFTRMFVDDASAHARLNSPLSMANDSYSYNQVIIDSRRDNVIGTTFPLTSGVGANGQIFTMGSWTTTGANGWFGDMGEWFMYNRKLTESEFSQVFNYLKIKHNTAWQPTQISSLIGWYDFSAQSSITLNVNDIASIADRSSAASSLSQPTVALQPGWATSNFPGTRPCVAFNRTAGDYLQGTLSGISGDYTVYIVFSYAADPGLLDEDAIFSIGDATVGNEVALYVENNITVHWRLDTPGQSATGGAAVINTGYIARIQRSGNTATLDINGVSTITMTQNADPDGTLLTLNALGDGTEPTASRIADFLVFSDALSGADDAMVVAYLEDKWGL